jgi:hypothetical protein
VLKEIREEMERIKYYATSPDECDDSFYEHCQRVRKNPFSNSNSEYDRKQLYERNLLKLGEIILKNLDKLSIYEQKSIVFVFKMSNICIFRNLLTYNLKDFCNDCSNSLCVENQEIMNNYFRIEDKL